MVLELPSLMVWYYLLPYEYVELFITYPYRHDMGIEKKKVLAKKSTRSRRCERHMDTLTCSHYRQEWLMSYIGINI
jgi:hypothetical protein